MAKLDSLNLLTTRVLDDGESLAPPLLALFRLLVLLSAPVDPARRVANIAKERVTLVGHDLEMGVPRVNGGRTRADGRGGRLGLGAGEDLQKQSIVLGPSKVFERSE